MNATAAELLKDTLASEIAKLVTITQEIEVVRGLPDALAELNALEEKIRRCHYGEVIILWHAIDAHDTQVDEVKPASSAVERACLLHAIDAYDAWMDANKKFTETYKFVPDCRNETAVDTYLTHLVNLQQQIVAKIKTVSGTLAAIEQRPIEDVVSNVAENTATDPVGQPPAIVARTATGVFLFVRKDIAAGWSWDNLPKEILDKYTMETLREHCRKRTEGIIDVFEEYHYNRDNTPSPGFAATCETAFTLIDLLYQDQGNTAYECSPNGYDIIFRYSVHPGTGNRNGVIRVIFNRCLYIVCLKQRPEWFFGVYDNSCNIVIHPGAVGHINIPIWIHSSFKVRI